MGWKRNSTTQEYRLVGKGKSKWDNERIKNKWEAIFEEMLVKRFSTVNDVNPKILRTQCLKKWKKKIMQHITMKIPGEDQNITAKE